MHDPIQESPLSQLQELPDSEAQATAPAYPNRLAAATYGILVTGVLPASWAPFVHNLEIYEYASGGDCPITCLTGELPDQAALIGVINRLDDLGFTLLAVECFSWQKSFGILEPELSDPPA